MTPAQAIKSLDAQLRLHGEDIVYHVMSGGSADVGTTVRAFVRGYKPDELAEGITQKDRKVAISPSAGVEPVEGSRIVIGGKAHRIEAVETIRMSGEVVRYNLQARG